MLQVLICFLLSVFPVLMAPAETSAAAAAPDLLMAVSNGADVAYACAAPPGRSVYVVAKGERRGPYEALKGLAWSPDGSRLVYQAKSGGSWRLYDGASASAPCDDFGEILWAQDGSEPAWAAPSGGAWFVHRGEAAYGPYDDVADLSFAGQRLAWNAKVGVKWFVALDGRTAGPFDSIESVLPSPDGSMRATIAARDGGQFLCRAQGLIGPVEKLGAAWSGDGKSLLYSYIESGKAWFCSDDLQHGPYDEVRFGAGAPLLASADLWSCRLGSKWYIWDGGKKLGPFDDVYWMGRGPDGKSLHYAMRRDDQVYIVTGKAKYGPLFGDYAPALWNDARAEVMPIEETDEGKYLLDGDLKIGPYEGFDEEVSPGGKTHAVWIYEDAKSRIVLEGGRVSEPFERSNWPLAWSPDEGKFAFTTSPEDYQAFLFDGAAFKGPYANPQNFIWSPDGARLAFWTQGDDGDAVIAGDKEIMRFDRGTLDLRFSPDGGELLCVHHEGWAINSPARVRRGDADYGPYLDVADFRWSADGKKVAWKARDAAGCSLVAGGEAFGTYDDIRAISWIGDAIVFEGYRDGAWRSRAIVGGVDRPGCRAGGRVWYMDGSKEALE